MPLSALTRPAGLAKSASETGARPASVREQSVNAAVHVDRNARQSAPTENRSARSSIRPFHRRTASASKSSSISLLGPGRLRNGAEFVESTVRPTYRTQLASSDLVSVNVGCYPFHWFAPTCENSRIRRARYQESRRPAASSPPDRRPGHRDSFYPRFGSGCRRKRRAQGNDGNEPCV